MFFTQLYFWRLVAVCLFIWGGGLYSYLFYKKYSRLYAPLKKFDICRALVLFSFFFSFLFGFLVFLWPRVSLGTLNTAEGVNMAFVLDVSKSMSVVDIEQSSMYTSRILAAKKLIASYITSHPENKYALSIFAGGSDRSLPFTTDTNLFLTLLSGASSKNIAEGGTNIVAAMHDALLNFSPEEESWVIVVMTDGGDDPLRENMKEIYTTLQDKHIAVMVVWVWTSQGGYIPIGKDAFWDVAYKVYQWKRVVSNLNQSFLKSLANALWWEYAVFSLIDFQTFESKLFWLWERVLIAKQENSMSLSYVCIWISFVLFFIGFLLSIFDTPFLWRKK